MVDLSDKLCDQEMSNNSGENVPTLGKVMTCTDCGTTKTPLWRGGPAGPKSLCNACGIRSRKRRRALLGLNNASTEHKKPKKINSNKTISIDANSGSKSNIGNTIESNFFAFRVPMTWQKTKLRRKLGQEEQAARVLMALSCGSVYA